MNNIKTVLEIDSQSLQTTPYDYYFENTENVIPKPDVVKTFYNPDSQSDLLHWLTRLDNSKFSVNIQFNKKLSPLNDRFKNQSIIISSRSIFHIPWEWFAKNLEKNNQIIIDHTYECDGLWSFSRVLNYLKQKEVLPNKNLFVLLGSKFIDSSISDKLKQTYGCTFIDVNFFRLYEAWWQSGELYGPARNNPLKAPYNFDKAQLEFEKTKNLLSLNRFCKIHRLGITEFLKKNKFLENSFVSARWGETTEEFKINYKLFLKDHNAGAKWFKNDCKNFGIDSSYVKKSLESYPLLLDEPLKDIYQTDRYNKIDWYTQSFYSLITETVYNDYLPSHTGIHNVDIGRNKIIFITEKTYKAIYCGHPFLIMGQPYILKTLKDMDFETYENLFDETYDNIENDKLRFEKVCENILNFDNPKHYNKLTKDKILHNRNLMLDSKYVVKQQIELFTRLGWR